MQRIKASEVKTYRELYAKEQNNICPLCNKEIQDPVLEHDHKGGQLRGTTCRKCNSALGSIENAGKRYGIALEDLIQITKNFESHINNTKPFLHPSYRTPEEKKARAKKKRAKCNPKSKRSSSLSF